MYSIHSTYFYFPLYSFINSFIPPSIYLIQSCQSLIWINKTWHGPIFALAHFLQLWTWSHLQWMLRRTYPVLSRPIHTLLPLQMWAIWARKRPVYTMRFSCDFSCNFDAILRKKPAQAYPTRVFSRVMLRQIPPSLIAEIGKRGLQLIYDIIWLSFQSSRCFAKKASVQVG